MEDGIPKQIGRYTVDRLLGSGAMGFVFLGRDPELDRPVAIKTVRDLGLSDDNKEMFLERFRNEAKAAGRLVHANVVQVYDVGQQEDVGPYMVFEYVAGSSLKQIIRSKAALSPLRVVRLAEEVAGALTVAHKHNIIHRDIKPDNLLVTPDGTTKLADFGVARVPNATLTREGQFLGTPCYAAPETLSEGRYGVHSDLFSFAAVMYEAASGTRAFPGQEAVAVASKVLHDHPPDPSTVAKGPAIPKEVDAVIMRGLDKNPDNRLPDAQSFALAIRHAYEDAGLIESNRTGSQKIQTQDPSEEPRAALAFFAVVVFGILGVAAFFAFQNMDGNPEWDAGTDVLASDAGLDASATNVPDASFDAEVSIPDAQEDAKIDAVLDSAPDTELDLRDQEEIVKDALDDARRGLQEKNRSAVDKALAQVRRIDPEHPDLSILEKELKLMKNRRR